MILPPLTSTSRPTACYWVPRIFQLQVATLWQRRRPSLLTSKRVRGAAGYPGGIGRTVFANRCYL